MRKRRAPIWRNGRGRLSSLFLLLIPLLACLSGESPFMLLLGASAVVWHEGGHLFFFLLAGEPPPRLGADAFGLRLRPSLPLSPEKEAFICLGGPLFNLLAGGLLLICRGEFFHLYGVLHLLLAFFNLFPVLSTDGGRLLSFLLHRLLPEALAASLFRLISALLLLFLFFFCAFLFYFGGIGLYGVFFSLFFFWRTVREDFDNFGDFKRF